MSLQQELGVKDVIVHIIGDVAKAISERPGEDRREQATRVRVATAAMEDFHPQNVAQAMLAGFCVMFHAVMTDSVHITLRGELEAMRRATRSNIVAMNKSFHMNLERLDGVPKQDAARLTEAAAARLAHEADIAVTVADVAITPEAVAPPGAEAPAPVVPPGPLAASEPPHSPAPEVTLVPTPEVPRASAPNGAAEPRRPQVPIGAAQPRHPHARSAGGSGHSGQTGGNGSVPTAPVPAIAKS